MVKGIRDSFVQELHLIFEWTVVLWLLFMQRRDNEPCTLRQGWMEKVIPMFSNTELFRDYDCNRDMNKS